MVETPHEQPPTTATNHVHHAGPSNDSTKAMNGEDSADPAPGEPAASATNGTKALNVQEILASMVPKEVAQYAPLLVGKYYIQDKRAVWAGRWGMTEAAFGGNGLTSAFEMKSQEDVYIRQAQGDAERAHPVFAEGAALAKSSAVTNPPSARVTPVYLGYESDPSVRSAVPFDCQYSGFFQIQAVKGKPQTVTEKDVALRFVHDATRPRFFHVSGTGENRFGRFSLLGLLDKDTSELRLYKIYKPKDPKPAEKRTLPKRTRATAAAPRTMAAAAVTTVPKVQTKATTAAVPPPVAIVTPPAPAKLSTTPAPGPAAGIVVPPRVTALATPLSDAQSPSVSAGRGRSERKIKRPAHLRNENVIDHDRVPPALKKCHAILKGLMANPKAGPFLMPVDPIALGIPDYFDVIKEPMDLGTIRQNLEGGFLEDASIFVDHVRLVFRNAMLYNAAHSQVHIFAAKLSEDFEKRIKTLKTKDRLSDKYSTTPTSSIIKLKRERKSEPTYASKKVKGGKGTKGHTKRQVADDKEGLIMSLKEDIERLKATLEQLQPSAMRTATPKTSKAASKPFRMEDLTEEELNEPMTQADKARLSADIRQLPQDKINRVLQIIAESVPVSKLTNENDEVEIDINSFDTRCLRMLEGYVRENGIGRKRKRPTAKKATKSAPVSHRLKSAKVAALNIRSRQEELKNQLAAIDGGAEGSAVAPPAIPVDLNGDISMEKPKEEDSSSDSSSSSSDSSDSESESDSESDSDGGAPLQRSPVLTGGSTLSQLSEASTRADAAKKIRDEVASTEPLKVENRGAWSLLARKDSSSSQSLMQPEENQTSSLWMSARSMEQIKQQKLQKERHDELEAQRRRDAEQREKEKEREREEMERRIREEEAAARVALEERAKEAERARAAQRAMEREKLVPTDDLEEHHDHTLTEDLESFSSSSFL